MSLAKALKRRVAYVGALFAAVIALLVASTVPANAGPISWHSNHVTNECLDDSINGLQTLPCNFTNYQKWEGKDVISGIRRMINQHTGACLTYNPGGRPYASWCTYPNVNQEWRYGFKANGALVLRPNRNVALCLDDSVNGLQTLLCNDTPWQQWTRAGW